MISALSFVLFLLLFDKIVRVHGSYELTFSPTRLYQNSMQKIKYSAPRTLKCTWKWIIWNGVSNIDNLRILY